MIIKLSNSFDDKRLEEIKALYLQAFPKEERKPFEMITKTVTDGTGDIFSIEDKNGGFCGLAILLFYKSLVLIDYLAIDKSKRGSGIGTKALKAVKSLYPNKTVFLEIESTKTGTERMDEKTRRKHFYQKCGMTELGYEVNLFNVVMELMSFGEYISFEEYYQLYEGIFGKEIHGHKTKDVIAFYK